MLTSPCQSLLLLCSLQFININLICYKVSQQCNSTLKLSWFYYDPVSNIKPILLWKKGKIRNSDLYNSSGTLTQKSLQWFRLQINDPVSIQPEHCIEVEKKLGHLAKVNQIQHLTRASILVSQYATISIAFLTQIIDVRKHVMRSIHV